MKNNMPTNGLLLYPALLCIWLTVSSAAFFYTDINTAMGGTLILAAIAIATLSLGSGILVFSVNLLTIIVYGAMIYFVYGLKPSSILIFITFAAAVSGATYLTWNMNKQFQLLTRKVERDHLLIEDMRIKDEKTGLMRFHYARKALSTEISRSLRFGKQLVLLLLKINNWEELAEQLGIHNRETLFLEVSELLFNNCRNIDTLFLNIDRIGIILPETDIKGGELFARRLSEQIARRVKHRVFIGIAVFPDDSIIDDDLLRKCDIALRTAMENDRDIVLFSESLNNNEPLNGDASNLDQNEYDEIKTDLGNSIETIQTVLPDENAVYVKGTKTIEDIEPLQKAFSNISEIENVRLVDYKDNKVLFAVKSDSTQLPELLLTRLEIPNISIEEHSGVITINLDPYEMQ